MKFALALLFATLAVVSCSHVLYTRTSVPRGWSMTGLAAGHHHVTFMIALKQNNLDVLEQLFWEVSDPRHEKYQQFMSPKQIISIIAPEHETVHAVKHWLKSHGAANIKDFGDALEVRTTVSIASSLFSTTFHHFKHQDGASIIRQWGSYSVPASIGKHVDMVTGLSTFPVPHYKLHKAKSPMDVHQGISTQTLYSIYEIRDQTMAASNQTSTGVIEFEGQFFAPADLAYFASEVNISAQVVSPSNIVGPNDPTFAGEEAELDIELIATVNIESTPWFWLENGDNSNAWLYSYGVHFFTATNIPQIASISYGWWEGDQCDTGIGADECAQLGVDSQGYVARVNIEFQKIGLRGTSIIVASGDSGANGRTNEDCSMPQLRADFPASSPFVTTVGATQLINSVYNLTTPPPICTGHYSCPSGGQEVAVSYAVAGFASGGGFSMYAQRPAYQAQAVNAYISSGVALPPASYWNSTGRGFPDVAAIGNNALYYHSALMQPAAGTSVSTPIFAGVVGLLNEISMKKAGQPLGFLNPLLYQAAAADATNFHDITVGDNKCTESGCGATCDGYLATKGWDPVTGLGSPNYARLSSYVTQQLDAKLAKKHHKKH